MNKILIITPNCPFPPHKSGGIHTLYNLIMYKRKEDLIDLLYYDEKDTIAEQEINKHINKMIYMPLRKKCKSLARIMSLLKKAPYGIFQYNSSKINVNELYDMVIFDQNLSIEFIKYVSGKQNILLAHDSMILYFKRKAKLQKKYNVSYCYNLMQSRFYYDITRKLYTKFDKVYFVSNLDSKYEISQNKQLEDKIDYINLGVDYKSFNIKNYTVESEENSIIFTGIMDYEPNKDAVLFLAKRIMPKLLEKYKNLKLYIVGKNPDSEILDLKSDNIVVTGFVDDIVEYICKAKVYVSPLRFGTGMKNKILEAMSCEKAIVASEVSIEGIDELENNKNIFVCKTEEEWIKNILELLENEELNKNFGSECRKIILQNYSWKEAYNKLMKN